MAMFTCSTGGPDSFRHPQHGLPAAVYPWQRKDGRPIARAKYRAADGSKTCAWWVHGDDWYLSHGDVKEADLLPYNHDLLGNPHARDELVAACEGEKDAETASRLGIIGTDSRTLSPESVQDRDVLIIRDRDPESSRTTGGGYGRTFGGETPGENYARRCYERLKPVAKRIAIIEMPGDFKDLSDWDAAHPGTDAEKRAILLKMFEVAAGHPEVEPDTPATWELPCLPDEFYAARPLLRIIRAVAQQYMIHPDALLGAVLSRLPAILLDGTMMDTGIGGPPICLCFAAIILGRPGSSKSAVSRISKLILPIPPGLKCVVNELGSGPGIAEAFMGSIKNPDENSPIKTIRAQTGIRAHLTVDEVARLLKRSDLEEILADFRSATSGSDLGRQNASAETTRCVKGYGIGLTFNCILDAIGEFFRRAGDGTPQRSMLFGFGQISPKGPAVEIPTFRPPRPAVYTFAPDLQKRLEDLHLQQNNRPVAGPGEEDMEGHGTRMMALAATLLCILDYDGGGDQRNIVNAEDWRLMEMLMANHRALQDYCTRWMATDQERLEQIAVDAKARSNAVSSLSARVAPDKADSIARRIGLRVHRFPAGQNRTNLKDNCCSGPLEKTLLDTAIAIAEANAWIEATGTGRHVIYIPGSGKPV